jgi:DNA processing protein
VEQVRNKMNLQEKVVGESAGASPASEISGHSRLVLKALKHDAPVTMEALVEALEGLTLSDIMACLFELEMTGVVRQLPGRSYIKVWGE